LQKKKIIIMKKLLRSQMKNVIGGRNLDCGAGSGTASAGDSCYYSGGNCAHTCKTGNSCVDQGNETGSICKKSATEV
jgi:hypothetical protein